MTYTVASPSHFIFVETLWGQPDWVWLTQGHQAWPSELYITTLSSNSVTGSTSCYRHSVVVPTTLGQNSKDAHWLKKGWGPSLSYQVKKNQEPPKNAPTLRLVAMLKTIQRSHTPRYILSLPFSGKGSELSTALPDGPEEVPSVFLLAQATVCQKTEATCQILVGQYGESNCLGVPKVATYCIYCPSLSSAL